MNIFKFTNATPSDTALDECDLAAAAVALVAAGHGVAVFSPPWPPSPGLGNGFERRFFGETPASASPDIVHAHEPFLAGEHALAFSAEAGVPLVFTADLSYDPPLALDEPEAAALGAFIEKLGVCFANRCDAVIAPSPALALRLFQQGVTRPIHVAPHPRHPSALAAHAARLVEIYRLARGRRRARVRGFPPASVRLRHELALAWERARPAAGELGRRGAIRFARDDTALPC